MKRTTTSASTAAVGAEAWAVPGRFDNHYVPSAVWEAHRTRG